MEFPKYTHSLASDRNLVGDTLGGKPSPGWNARTCVWPWKNFDGSRSHVGGQPGVSTGQGGLGKSGACSFIFDPESDLWTWASLC